MNVGLILAIVAGTVALGSIGSYLTYRLRSRQQAHKQEPDIELGVFPPTDANRSTSTHPPPAPPPKGGVEVSRSASTYSRSIDDATADTPYTESWRKERRRQKKKAENIFEALAKGPEGEAPMSTEAKLDAKSGGITIGGRTFTQEDSSAWDDVDLTSRLGGNFGLAQEDEGQRRSAHRQASLKLEGKWVGEVDEDKGGWLDKLKEIF